MGNISTSQFFLFFKRVCFLWSSTKALTEPQLRLMMLWLALTPSVFFNVFLYRTSNLQVDGVSARAQAKAGAQAITSKKLP